MLTKNEIAELLQVSRATIDRLREKGMPSHKIGKQVRFDENEVKEWVKKQN